MKRMKRNNREIPDKIKKYKNIKEIKNVNEIA